MMGVLLAPVGFDAMGDPEFLAKAYPLSLCVLALRSIAPAWLRRLGAEAMARYELRDQPARGEAYYSGVRLLYVGSARRF
ncbi:MAG: hypothetical protein CM15mP74_21240 [Halieaceae bacterium]|nr:MAG: hypothetical protein CM15mP74_21240 [Halieaceae bacterium]